MKSFPTYEEALVEARKMARRWPSFLGEDSNNTWIVSYHKDDITRLPSSTYKVIDPTGKTTKYEKGADDSVPVIRKGGLQE